MIKETIRAVSPPILWSAAKKVFPAPAPPDRLEALNADKLFGGDDELFKRLLTTSTVYAEYGCGQSTVWAAKNAKCRIFSVDTSVEWVERVQSALSDYREKLDLRAIDLGPLGDWGRPLSYGRRQVIPDYLQSPWHRSNEEPDLVLIDGRFRVACFFETLLEASPGTKIIFDDYTIRDHYHIVEEFCPRIDVCGRQALFEVLQDIPRDAIRQEQDRFMYVMA